jgi:hypothetical protein
LVAIAVFTPKRPAQTSAAVATTEVKIRLDVEVRSDLAVTYQ